MIEEQKYIDVLNNHEEWSKWGFLTSLPLNKWIRKSSMSNRKFYTSYFDNGYTVVELVNDYLFKGNLGDLSINLDPDKSLIEVLIKTNSLEMFEEYINKLY